MNDSTLALQVRGLGVAHSNNCKKEMLQQKHQRATKKGGSSVWPDVPLGTKRIK